MSTGHQQFLAPDDMAMIERVLEGAGFHKSQGPSVALRDAARFLTREFQDGVIDEAELAQALERYLAARGTWRVAMDGREPPRKAPLQH